MWDGMGWDDEYLLGVTLSILVRRAVKAGHLIIQDTLKRNIQYSLGVGRHTFFKGQCCQILLFIVLDLLGLLPTQS